MSNKGEFLQKELGQPKSHIKESLFGTRKIVREILLNNVAKRSVRSYLRRYSEPLNGPEKDVNIRLLVLS